MKFSTNLTKAVAYAAEAHAGHLRKKTRIPYLAHLLGVASIVLEYGGTETETIGALLHDVVEDAGGIERLHEIRREFGVEVSEIVEGCSDSYGDPKPPWEERKQKYLAHLPKASASVRLVSAADRLYNARAILKDLQRVGDTVWDRFNATRDRVMWYYQESALVYKQIGPHDLGVELDRVLDQIKSLTKNTTQGV